MTTKNERFQKYIGIYKNIHGDGPINMDDVADWLMKQGIDLPRPKTQKELLVQQLSAAARTEYRRDPKTGLSYRANHALRVSRNDKQMTLWVDIDKATRPQMLMSLTNRREQIVCDAYHLTVDAMAWNNRNPEEKPIQLDMDFTEDVEERLNAPGYGIGEVA